MKEYEKLNHSSLSRSLTGAYRNQEEGVLVFFFKDEAGVYVSNKFVSTEMLQQWGEALSGTLALAIMISPEMTELICVSKNEEIRALEFMDFITEEYGNCDGDAVNARGEISTMLLRLEQGGKHNLETFFLERASDYFTKCQSIYPWDLNDAMKEDLKSWPLYEKKKVPWAVVRSLDITQAGNEIKVRSLENTTGTHIIAGEDCCIMIGLEGEVYDISRKTFENTYDLSDESLDIFEKVMSSIPAVEIMETGEYIAIDTMAKLCYPKSGMGIYVKKLEQRTKVFRQEGSGEYFLGNKGDYLVARKDNMQDMYIIQKDIFSYSYEKISD